MTKSWSAWAPLPLRLMLGIAFNIHGLQKFGLGHEFFAGSLHAIGVPAAPAMAWFVALLEVVGGLALIAGAFVTVFGTLLVLEQLVALFKVHLLAGYNFVHVMGMSPTGPIFGLPGYEVNLLIIAGLLTLILGGAGPGSVDAMRAKGSAPGMAAPSRP